MYSFKVIFDVTMFATTKTSRNSKAKNYVEKLEERLKFWNEDHIEEIIQETRTI